MKKNPQQEKILKVWFPELKLGGQLKNPLSNNIPSPPPFKGNLTLCQPLKKGFKPPGKISPT